MTSTATIEELWGSLEGGGTPALRRRVDGTHPLDLYAEFEAPDRPGLLLLCPGQPPETRPLRSVRVDRGRRADGRWWLRLSLSSPDLRPVFAALCRDVVTSTRAGVPARGAAGVVLARLDRWRALLEGERGPMSPAALRGLIAELAVLEQDLLPALPVADAVNAWQGPLGAAQDFLLPSGALIEVKSARPGASTVRINGLDQLDVTAGSLTLTVVRLAETGIEAEEGLTASRLIDRMRKRLDSDPAVLNEFDSLLAAAGWRSHPDHDRTVVWIAAVERHPVVPGFPRLTRRMVPTGIQDASYTIVLPGEGLP